MVSFSSLISGKDKICIIGLGYVGLPLAVKFSKYFKVVGYDINNNRIIELSNGVDRTLEVSKKELLSSRILFSNYPISISECRFIIISVPTDIHDTNIPNLNPLKTASTTAGKYLQKGSCVVFESTVYPGATEEVCVPILEQESGLKLHKDFIVGYSPERINPGDKVQTLDNITKVVSGCNKEATYIIRLVYKKIIKSIYTASSIQVAEAAKIIENIQRDINIALVNELALLFDRMNINTNEVLDAANTKWNFLPFKPGLVGGHCVGVDPYYLTYKATAFGYYPEIILAGRRINNYMAVYIARKTIDLMILQNLIVNKARVAILGITFKEDIPDIRNTKVYDIIRELNLYNTQIFVHDPIANRDEVKNEYGIEILDINDIKDVNAIIVAVNHKYYIDMGLDNITKLCDGTPIIIDVKGIFDQKEMLDRDIIFYQL